MSGGRGFNISKINSFFRLDSSDSESSSVSPVVTIPETLTLFGAPLEFQGEERGLISQIKSLKSVIA